MGAYCKTAFHSVKKSKVDPAVTPQAAAEGTLRKEKRDKKKNI